MFDHLQGFSQFFERPVGRADVIEPFPHRLLLRSGPGGIGEGDQIDEGFLAGEGAVVARTFHPFDQRIRFVGEGLGDERFVVVQPPVVQMEHFVENPLQIGNIPGEPFLVRAGQVNAERVAAGFVGSGKSFRRVGFAADRRPLDVVGRLDRDVREKMDGTQASQLRDGRLERGRGA